MDYATHMTSVIDRMATVYSLWAKVDPVVVKGAIIDNIESSLSDR